MIHLHCHLDGSLDLETSRAMLKRRGKDISFEELKKEMTVQPGCTSLAEYLEKFELPISILQEREEIREGSYAVARNAALDGVHYLEVRFAPAFHMAEGLSVSQILESVEQGLAKARDEFPDFYTGIIVCGMRGMDEKINLEMVRAAREFVGSGVVACDLAGNEAAYPPFEYRYFFEEAKRLEMIYTIHAGECGSAQNVVDSIELGAKRIGHGIAAMRDETVMKFVASRGIGFEICPTSNFQTKAVATPEEYPIRTFMEHGIRFNISTDNSTVSGTTLSNEYRILAERFGMTDADFAKVYRDSVDMAFCNDEIKDRLLKL